VINATFSNISAISWQPVLVVKEYPERTIDHGQATDSLGQRKSGLIIQVISFYSHFLWQDKKKVTCKCRWLLNRGDCLIEVLLNRGVCLIEVTTWTGLTVYISLLIQYSRACVCYGLWCLTIFQLYWWRKPSTRRKLVASHWLTVSHNVVSSTHLQTCGKSLTNCIT
jgi:hypothetical protein